eukprot:SM000024S07809  [mRNA]  locus=s24:665844:666990:+ [translate_table: standard]
MPHKRIFTWPLRQRQTVRTVELLVEGSMEDPKRDIVHVVRGLVQQPTLGRQAQYIRRYFAPDVKFFHFFIDIAEGADDLTAIYHFGELFFRYQAVEFHKIVYDSEEDTMVCHVTVGVDFLVLLDLEDYLPKQHVVIDDDLPLQADSDGKRKPLKRIKVQRDFFEKNPLLLLMPVIGQISGSHYLRAIAGRLQVGFSNMSLTSS